MPTKLVYRSYYAVKPWLPRRFRYWLRRLDAQRKRAQSAAVWPIPHGCETPPPNWPGWPQGKQFAFVITHDVEGRKGLDGCRQLVALEQHHGFRSSFNFVPEGEYRVSKAFREELAREGFEVGVHDLHHDGSLFKSHAQFSKQAVRINEHLKEWGAVGFRAGFMFHNLEWQQELNVSYDLSTFDNDPFEPQPDGTGTIFPFWVPKSDGRGGYMELPYTLTQDSTVFLFLEEKTIAVWKRKLDWVAEHGGMVLVNIHPDYMRFDHPDGTTFEFPSARYAELLAYVREKYEGKYWHALPREVAEYCAQFKPMRPARPARAPETLAPAAQNGAAPRVKIWIDLDNTPHVPFFIPIKRELERLGYTVTLTARDAFQVCDLAEKMGLSARKVGRHYGKNPLMKIWGLVWRSLQLLPIVWRERPDLALSHGSRSQIFLSNLLGIPTVMITDYEFAETPWLLQPRWEIVPRVLLQAELQCKNPERIKAYQGIKEDVYAPEFKPDPALAQQLGLDPAKIIVTVRPPANEAHYYNPESDTFFVAFMNRLVATSDAQAILLPRNKAQEARLRQDYPAWFTGTQVIVPRKAVDGLNLLWHSDLVVSGGGTMNREAVALSVPVYSIFRGKIGVLDRQLHEEGRMVLIERLADVHDKIILQRRNKSAATVNAAPRHALGDIVNHVTAILKQDCGK